MNSYQNCALEGASAVELTVALYDGIIRFMRRAIEAVDQGDTIERRIAVRRAMDIVMHLQATLKMDVGGRPAEVLAEFYTAVFALMLQGSQANSREKFERVITFVQNVRDAWRQVARGPNARPALPRTKSDDRQGQAGIDLVDGATGAMAGSSWTA